MRSSVIAARVERVWSVTVNTAVGSNAAILGRTFHTEQNAGRDEFCAGIARRTVALRLV